MSSQFATSSYYCVIALAIVGLPVEFGWIGGSFPHPGLSALPKFLLVDSTAQLAELGKLLDSGTVRVVVDRTFPLASAAAAHEALAAGGVHGKVVLTV